MINEFTEFVKDVFPFIDPYKFDQFKRSILDFDSSRLNWFANNTLDVIAQGDIFDNFPVSFYDEEGEQISILTKVMILSNTCDIDHDEYIVIAPMFLIDTIPDLSPNEKKDIQNNVVYGKLCYKNSSLHEWFVDFTKVSSFNRPFLEKMLKQKLIQREYSLSDYGFYFLITKLTIHFMRSENVEVNNARCAFQND